MAYLYAYSAVWRSIVDATRNPKIMALFATATTAGVVLLWRGSEELTRSAMATTKEEMKKKVENDQEMKRYAETSERALAALFAQIGQGQKENAEHLKHEFKLPGVEWHPKAELRDHKKTEQQKSGDTNKVETKGKWRSWGCNESLFDSFAQVLITQVYNQGASRCNTAVWFELCRAQEGDDALWCLSTISLCNI